MFEKLVLPVKTLGLSEIFKKYYIYRAYGIFDLILILKLFKHIFDHILGPFILEDRVI